MNVNIALSSRDLSEVQVDLLRVRDSDFKGQDWSTLITDEAEGPTLTILVKGELEFHREPQGLGGIKVGLLVDPAELDTLRNHGLMGSVQEGALRIWQGA
jgi:hypothetical protein